MVAYEDTVTMGFRKASGGGLVQSWKSGEGFVFDFTGPGKVWTQTRNPSELLSWISASSARATRAPVERLNVGGLFSRD